MKRIFGKNWWFILVIFFVIVGFAAGLQYFRETNSVAEWIFKFLSDWAVILSATVGLLIVISALLAIQENRRSEARRKIRKWAEDIVLNLYKKDTEEQILELTSLWYIRGSIFYDSKFLGDPIVSKVRATLYAFFEYFFRTLPKKDKLYTKDGKPKQMFIKKRGALNNCVIDLIEVLTKD